MKTERRKRFLTKLPHYFAIATDWPEDRDFITLIEENAHRNGISTFVVSYHNLKETIYRIEQGEIRFFFYLDRASDTSPEFLELHILLKNSGVPILDSWKQSVWAADKAAMHEEFTKVPIATPKSTIIAALNGQEKIGLEESDLIAKGIPFILKPARTFGGGIGVVKNARSLQDIATARQAYPEEKYLLQEKIIPQECDGHRFWFRGFHVYDLILAAWWNDQTHIYSIISSDEIEDYGLYPIYTIIDQIARVCRLNFFSTEIAMDTKGDFIAIDYVNEVCDMRPKSHYPDGVPDEIVWQIADRILIHVLEVVEAGA